jgi:hypothetical protein
MAIAPRVPRRFGLLAAFVYLAAALVLTWPLAADFDTHLPAVGDPYDALLHVFLLGWGWHGLTTDPLDVFDAPIFYPEVRTLTYMDHMLGQAVLGGPVIALFGIGAGYNFLVILSFVTSGYFVYRLAGLYGISRWGSLVAGFLFAFCPYRFSHLGCLNQIQTQFIPLGIYFAVRFLRTGRTRYGVGAALTLAVQSYFGWYATFHLAAALVALLGWEVLRERGRWRQVPWKKGVPLALISAVLILPSALPYLLQHRAMPEFDRPFSETVRLSADVIDYLKVNTDNVLARFFPWLAARWAGFFPGLVGTVLAVVAIVALRRGRATGERGETGYLSVLWLTGFVLSLGPFLHVAGVRLWIPLPYGLFYYIVPGFSSMRTPGRFAVLVALATAVLAGIGFDALRARYPRLGPTFAVITILVAGVFAWNPTIPFVVYPDRASMPPVYEWLAEQPDSDPVLEVPVPRMGSVESPTDLRRQMYVLYHGKPRLDGASGFTSNRYEDFRGDMQAFPGPETIERAFDMGARRLIVHYGDYSQERREEVKRGVEEGGDLIEVAAFGQDVVYDFATDAARARPD